MAKIISVNPTAFPEYLWIEALKESFMQRLFEIHQANAALGRPRALETAYSFMVDVRDLGVAQAAMAALVAADDILEALKTDSPWSLGPMTEARNMAIQACRRCA